MEQVGLFHGGTSGLLKHQKKVFDKNNKYNITNKAVLLKAV